MPSKLYPAALYNRSNSYVSVEDGATAGATVSINLFNADGTLVNLSPVDNSITNSKLADMPTSTLKGRVTAGTGDPEDLTVAQSRVLLSISNVDNTSDANKPVSTAQAAAGALKANLTGAAFTGAVSTTSFGVGGGASFGAQATFHSPNGAQAFLNLWQAGVGTGGIGFAANSSVMRIVNTYADGTLAGGVGIDIDTAGGLTGVGISAAAGNNTLVKRTAAGYIFANYFNTTANDIAGNVAGRIAIETGADGYIRWQTATNFLLYTTPTLDAKFRDVYANRADGSGVVFLNAAGTRYVYFDGTNYAMPGTNLFVNGSQVWTGATFDPATKLGVSAKAADSQLLDGIDSTCFVSGDNANKTTSYGVGNMNTAIPSGFYEFQPGSTGAPTAGWAWALNFRHTNTTTPSGQYGWQLSNAIDTNDFYVRNVNAGIWKAWNKIALSTAPSFTGPVYINGLVIDTEASYMRFAPPIRSASTTNDQKLAANGAAWINVPRIFVQSTDPGAQAADGDLWMW